jgi:hypothetical protein
MNLSALLDQLETLVTGFSNQMAGAFFKYLETSPDPKIAQVRRKLLNASLTNSNLYDFFCDPNDYFGLLYEKSESFDLVRDLFSNMMIFSILPFSLTNYHFDTKEELEGALEKAFKLTFGSDHQMDCHTLAEDLFDLCLTQQKKISFQHATASYFIAYHIYLKLAFCNVRDFFKLQDFSKRIKQTSSYHLNSKDLTKIFQVEIGNPDLRNYVSYLAKSKLPIDPFSSDFRKRYFNDENQFKAELFDQDFFAYLYLLRASNRLNPISQSAFEAFFNSDILYLLKKIHANFSNPTFLDVVKDLEE